MEPGNQAQTDRFAPPVAEVADVASQRSGDPAGRGTRLLAAIVDGVIQAALMWIISLLTPLDIFGTRGASFVTVVLAQLVSFVLFLVLQGWLLATRGQTIGKMLTSIRIVRPDGSVPSVGRGIGLRYALGWFIYMIPIVGFLYALVDALFIFRENRRCVHDLIADTIVVKA